MLNVNKIKRGELIVLNPQIKPLMIYNGKFEIINKKSVAMFIKAEKHSAYIEDALETFWKIDLLLNNKKIILFLPTSSTNDIHLLKENI